MLLTGEGGVVSGDRRRSRGGVREGECVPLYACNAD